MAETYTLDAQVRRVTGKKVGQLRRDGIVPVIVYGSKIEPMSLQVPYRALQLALLKAGGTHIINLNVEGGKPTQVLARSVQRDVLKGDILHVDFLAVDAATKIATEVPIHLIGESPAVKAGLGVLLNGVQTIQVEALPADLIDHVTVDLSALKNVGDSVHVRDITVNDKVAILSDGDEIVVRVTVQAEVVIEEEAPSAAEVEVVKKGKADEEAEEE